MVIRSVDAWGPDSGVTVPTGALLNSNTVRIAISASADSEYLGQRPTLRIALSPHEWGGR
jgi:hypothetical protein